MITLERLERAMGTLAAIIEKDGDAAWPIFERLERERDAILDKRRRLREARERVEGKQQGSMS